MLRGSCRRGSREISVHALVTGDSPRTSKKLALTDQNVNERCNVNRRIPVFLLLFLFAALSAGMTQAQDEPSAPPKEQSTGGTQGGSEGGARGQRPLFGKITAINDGSISITGPDGQAVTVKVTAQTEFRKDRQPAKIGDFKVGDAIMVRGEENPDHTVTASLIGGRTGAGMEGGPGGRPGGPREMGTLGKDYVAGEVKSVDAPKLTVMRTDGVTQTLELNEDTSLRHGRESITMADIKVGDHVFARGGVQNDAFVPRMVMVVSAEQWQRMQERMSQGEAGQPGNSNPNTPATKPQE